MNSIIQYRTTTQNSKGLLNGWTHWPFLWSMLNPTTNLKTFDKGLSNKKHIQILMCVEKYYSTSIFCM